MLEKLIKTINITEKDCYTHYLKYGKVTISDSAKDIFEENGIPQPTGELPALRVIMQGKTYVKDMLKQNTTNNLEKQVILELLSEAEMIEGLKQDIPELIAQADVQIFNETARFIYNTVVCNTNTSKIVEEEVSKVSNKNLIICDDLPDDYILVFYSPYDLISYAAILAYTDDGKHLLDIINPCLYKCIHIFEKYSCKLPEDYPMYDMCYCLGENCQTPCARKKGASGICTVSDLTKICSDYSCEEK